MTVSPHAAVVQALRVALEDPQESSTADVLIRSVEDVVFRMRALAPPGVVAERALLNHLQAGKIDESEDVAFADWEAAITVSVEQFLTDPVAATDDGCARFLESCCCVFGLESDAVLALLREFSRLTEAQRVGIFLSIDRSTEFSFLSRLIDAAPADTPFENPTKSMRALLSRTFDAK